MLNKLDKSTGLDNIDNEILKSAQIYTNPCILKLFNKVFTSVIYPPKWVERYITLIFKSENPRLLQQN
jgi:hypothetical protein